MWLCSKGLRIAERGFGSWQVKRIRDKSDGYSWCSMIGWLKDAVELVVGALEVVKIGECLGVVRYLGSR